MKIWADIDNGKETQISILIYILPIIYCKYIKHELEKRKVPILVKFM